MKIHFFGSAARQICYQVLPSSSLIIISAIGPSLRSEIAGNLWSSNYIDCRFDQKMLGIECTLPNGQYPMVHSRKLTFSLNFFQTDELSHATSSVVDTVYRMSIVSSKSLLARRRPIIHFNVKLDCPPNGTTIDIVKKSNRCTRNFPVKQLEICFQV